MGIVNAKELSVGLEQLEPPSRPADAPDTTKRREPTVYDSIEEAIAAEDDTRTIWKVQVWPFTSFVRASTEHQVRHEMMERVMIVERFTQKDIRDLAMKDYLKRIREGM
tara:strand:- start:499 stop:825 length:327 start_codon:yes stop_codon:yes gene_type:complete